VKFLCRGPGLALRRFILFLLRIQVWKAYGRESELLDICQCAVVKLLVIHDLLRREAVDRQHACLLQLGIASHLTSLELCIYIRRILEGTTFD
jgi:hypothetical protein